MSNWFFGTPVTKPFTKAGITFYNRVGLAAGFDKNAQYVEPLSRIGFGFIEIGTVTPLSQPGNAKPRLFRIKKENGLINRMGFNNKGVNYATERLQNINRSKLCIGGNIGKNKTTPNNQAIQDYLICFDTLFPYVNYFVVNVSSPNTPHLRELQQKDHLSKLLLALQDRNHKKQTPKPILLKISPDLNDNQVEEICNVVIHTRIQGIIATNTTTSREQIYSANKHENGGVSGLPLQKKSTQIIAQCRTLLGKEALIIGAGGIDSVQSAQDKIKAGADVVQIYTGMIYKGPSLIASIAKSLD